MTFELWLEREDSGNKEQLERCWQASRAAVIESAIRLAEDPYSDEVQAFAHDEPSLVGRKIAFAIRKLASY